MTQSLWCSSLEHALPDVLDWALEAQQQEEEEDFLLSYGTPLHSVSYTLMTLPFTVCVMLLTQVLWTLCSPVPWTVVYVLLNPCTLHTMYS